MQARVNDEPPPWLRVIPPQENVADLYRAAAIFLSCSRSEGLPYSVVEAMANGVPVVLSDIPAVAWAHQTPGAVFFPPGESGALADAIKTVLDWTPAEREQYAGANRDFVRREFDVQVWVEQVIGFYREML